MKQQLQREQLQEIERQELERRENERKLSTIADSVVQNPMSDVQHHHQQYGTGHLHGQQQHQQMQCSNVYGHANMFIPSPSPSTSSDMSASQYPNSQQQSTSNYLPTTALKVPLHIGVDLPPQVLKVHFSSPCVLHSLCPDIKILRFFFFQLFK